MKQTNQFNAAYKLAQCQASAKTMLLKLGVKASLLPGILEPETWQRSQPVKLVTRPKRFRRTRAEREQLSQFEQWQLQQRELKLASK